MKERIKELKDTYGTVQCALRKRYGRSEGEQRAVDIWKEAFKEYNEGNESKLGMGCAPCYMKVLNWLDKNGNHEFKFRKIDLNNSIQVWPND